MKSYTECKKIAVEKAASMGEKPTTVYDFGNAYCFTKKNYLNIGGGLPIVILKEDGKAVTMSTYVNMYDEGIEEIELNYNTGAKK